MTISQAESTEAGRLIPILATAVYIPLGLLSAPVAMMSVMFSDSGSPSGWAVLAFIGIFTFPIACLTTVPVAWTIWAATRKQAGTTKWRVLAALVPLVNVALVVIGLGALEAFCGGEFSGC